MVNCTAQPSAKIHYYIGKLPVEIKKLNQLHISSRNKVMSKYIYLNIRWIVRHVTALLLPSISKQYNPSSLGTTLVNSNTLQQPDIVFFIRFVSAINWSSLKKETAHLLFDSMYLNATLCPSINCMFPSGW